MDTQFNIIFPVYCTYNLGFKQLYIVNFLIFWLEVQCRPRAWDSTLRSVHCKQNITIHSFSKGQIYLKWSLVYSIEF